LAQGDSLPSSRDSACDKLALAKSVSALDGNLAGGVNAVNLKPVLGDVETDCGNLHDGRLLSIVAFSDDHVFGASTPGAGAIHPSKAQNAGAGGWLANRPQRPSSFDRTD
jgi:hypothetical protein